MGHLDHVVCEGSLGYQEELKVWRGLWCMCCPGPESTQRRALGGDLENPNIWRLSKEGEPLGLRGALGQGALLEGAGSMMSEGGILGDEGLRAAVVQTAPTFSLCESN